MRTRDPDAAEVSSQLLVSACWLPETLQVCLVETGSGRGQDGASLCPCVHVGPTGNLEHVIRVSLF